MTSWQRSDIVQRHKFYVGQVENRFLVLLSNEAMEAEANQTSEDSWELSGRSFDPEYNDPGDFAERAIEDGVARWELLRDLRNDLLLSSIAAIFHQWDKQLRLWLVTEIRRWHREPTLIAAVWRANFDDIFELLEGLGFNARSDSFFYDLDLCRLIVNVYKHGDGVSFDTLRDAHPKYLGVRPETDDDRHAGFAMPSNWRDHTYLEADTDDLIKFSNAILKFWHLLPDDFLDAETERLPKWFRNAL